MPVRAITPDYCGEMKDKVENFHGNQIVYVGWDHHLMFCAAFAYPLPPETPFRVLRDQVMPEAFSLHPQWESIDWEQTTWLLDGAPFVPQLDTGLQAQGIGHKSLLRFQTPELKGYQNAGV
ncbi:phenol hydroxylase P4 protein [Allopseudospirillum japonicum]|uniref:Phenol hydroxylase P4 protein n=1 Tax=Allopseudospirillum japonicum TaxID=64971 RepID=A0A1H6S1E4_9GAMM|nr:phenol hydroxylase subunit P4 [Allopseudospirillum japonicum]SEI59664.1 phenol hydroxylase P4 protein [Allopseudospirillum japonicum]